MQWLIAPAKEHGKVTGLHTRGRMEKVLPILQRIGFDVVHPMEPECNRSAWSSSRTVGVTRWLSWAGFRSLCSRAERSGWERIEEAVRDHCARLAPGGGYVLGASGPITDGIAPQNVWAMVQAAHKYGSYESLGTRSGVEDFTPPPQQMASESANQRISERANQRLADPPIRSLAAKPVG